MGKRMKPLRCVLAVLLIAVPMLFSGCAPEETLAPVTPIEESYEYTSTSRVYVQPAMLTIQRPVEYLSLTNDDGFFFCATADTEEANGFVNAQRTILQFLRDSGMETPRLNYFAMDFDDSFSESDKKRAHIALSHTNSYQQVLITLQTLWGDFTDYGYLHAVANVIAAHLGWQTGSIEEVEQDALDTFFAENPEALNLLYPCFTTTYASEETVRNCKALSKQLLEQIDLSEALAKPVDEQVNDFRALVDAYAQEISVTFSRQESGYAYYGEYIPLKVSTPYAIHRIDRGYKDRLCDYLKELGDDSMDYFSDYRSIFETITIINEEIARSITYFGAEDKVGIVDINWLSTESAEQVLDDPSRSIYYAGSESDLYDGTIYLLKIDAYLHEYFHHIDYSLSYDLNQSWQEQAFADLGRVQSQHARHVYEWEFMHEETWKRLFYDCFGREYQPVVEDYYNVCDVMCYLNSYELNYKNGGGPINSITRYLLDQYGEEVVVQILVFTDTVESVTGKTWEELENDWRQYMDEKSKEIKVPDWAFEVGN